MTILHPTHTAKVAGIVFILMLSGCSTQGAVNGVVDTTGFVAKTAVNGTVGAGKMVVRGVSGNKGK